MKLRSVEHILGLLSILLCLVFAGAVIAERTSFLSHQGFSFVSSLFAAFIISAYLDSRCKLDLKFGSLESVVWRSVSLATMLILFGAFMIIRDAEHFLSALSISFGIIIFFWAAPLAAIWALLLRDRERNRPQARRFAYGHILITMLVLSFWALEKKWL
ncbi:hypothetical protein D3871_16395 [Noviherbaspirillum saxi]|uniref:Uncharacterized protein n=1 Tax=Noviherbaspirillum saxi TaxID=2320863 RepID=A0A3A3FKP8_9BURK|nr:hypothetical protein D3871_16395 [Noviherbaspirillum saxi]